MIADWRSSKFRMSGFILRFLKADERKTDGEWDDGLSVSAFAKKCMPLTKAITGDGYALQLFSNPSHDPVRAMSWHSDGSCCTYVGTLIYRGRTGADATAALLNDRINGGLDHLDLALGNYCLIFIDKDGLRLVTDRAGLHHVYYDDKLRVVSNSFVATVVSRRDAQLRTPEVFEYVLLGATFGSRSLVQGVNLLDSETLIAWSHGQQSLIRRASVWPATAEVDDVDVTEQVEAALAATDTYYSQVASAFGTRITAALSGGYDSRLNLALLHRHGVTPRLFVYGKATDKDVEIAKLICSSEQLDLRHEDRSKLPRLTPEMYWENQEKVFHGLDGLTQYGFACEPYEFEHRRDRVSDGLLAMNGGGGEIWRDFWHLPDRPLSALEFVHGYFAGRLAGLRQAKCSDAEFLSHLAGKVRDVMQLGRDRMSVPEIQSLYPRLRLRFWQGKNNSVDNYVGCAVTPFSEHHFSVPAMSIPLGARKGGDFERAMIRRVSPRLASYPSSYGYTFSEGEPGLQRLKSEITRHLPTRIRALRRSTATSFDRTYYQSSEYVTARFGAKPLAVGEYFDMSHLGGTLAYSRALTIERMLRGEWIMT
jgi:hypothetical protein